MNTIKEIISLTNLSQVAFARKYGIPIRTLESWIGGKRVPPEYTLRWLERIVSEDINNGILSRSGLDINNNSTKEDSG